MPRNPTGKIEKPKLRETMKKFTKAVDALLLAEFAAPKPREAACDLGCGCGIIPLMWFAGGRRLTVNPCVRRSFRLP